MISATFDWTPPPLWSVPRLWAGESCTVICGGASIQAQRTYIATLTGRIIAVKHAAVLRPDADVLFWAGEHTDVLAPPVLEKFYGGEIVVRGKGHPVFPPSSRRIGRTPDPATFSTDRMQVGGYDAGTSAINLAALFGATTILVLGYDMTGNRWWDGPHPVPRPPESDFARHLSILPRFAAEAKRAGVRILNGSPISRVSVFERDPIVGFA